jgi:hypothetical protein
VIISFAPFICNLHERRALVIRSTHTNRLYADDTTVYSSSNSLALLCKYLQRYLIAPALWCRDWKVTINAMKSKAILISKERDPLLVPLTFNGVKIPWSSQAEYFKRNIWKSLSTINLPGCLTWTNQ